MRLVSSIPSPLHTAFSAIFPTLFLGLAAAAQVCALYIYLGNKPDFLLVNICFVLTAGTYLLNRIFDKEDKFNNVSRWNFFNGSKSNSATWIFTSIFALTFPIILFIALEKYNIALLFGIISSIGLIYTVKLIPILNRGKIFWINLKEIPVGKNIIVCAVWGGGAIAVSSIFLDINPFRPDFLMLFFAFFISNCNSNIGADARDIMGDKLRNVKTLSNIIGFKNTFILLTILNVIGIITTFLMYHFGIGNFKLALCSSLCILWAGISIIPQFFFPKYFSKTVIEILGDSHLLVCVPLLIFFTISD